MWSETQKINIKKLRHKLNTAANVTKVSFLTENCRKKG